MAFDSRSSSHSVPAALQKTLGAAVVVALLSLSPAGAKAIPNYAAEYLLIGTGPQSTAVAAHSSNWELGRNSEAGPWFTTETLPGNALPVATGIGGNGDTAITHPNGSFDFSNMDVWGDTGVDCAGTTGSCDSGHSNTDYNGSSMSNSNGIQGGVDLSGLTAQLAEVASDISALATDINLDFSDGKWSSDLVINLVLGLTVIDIDTHGNDLLLEQNNLLFDGPAGAFAVVRVPDEANFTVTQSNIIVGNGGIGSAMFCSTATKRTATSISTSTTPSSMVSRSGISAKRGRSI